MKASLSEEAQAASETLNDILFQMTPDMLDNDILETDNNIYTREGRMSHASRDREDLVATPPSSRFASMLSSPLPPPKRRESLADVASKVFKKQNGKRLAGDRGKGMKKRSTTISMYVTLEIYYKKYIYIYIISLHCSAINGHQKLNKYTIVVLSCTLLYHHWA